MHSFGTTNSPFYLPLQSPGPFRQTHPKFNQDCRDGTSINSLHVHLYILFPKHRLLLPHVPRGSKHEIRNLQEPPPGHRPTNTRPGFDLRLWDLSRQYHFRDVSAAMRGDNAIPPEMGNG